MTAKKLTSKPYDRLLEKKPIRVRATTPKLVELKSTDLSRVQTSRRRLENHGTKGRPIKVSFSQSR